MGQTIVGFAEKSGAENFAHQFGGHLLRFEDITLQVINTQPGDHMMMDMKH